MEHLDAIVNDFMAEVEDMLAKIQEWKEREE